MGYWNYRVVAEEVGGEYEYRIAEVYYREDGSIEGWSSIDYNVLGGWESLSGLRESIDLSQRAYTQNVLRVVDDKLVPWE